MLYQADVSHFEEMDAMMKAVNENYGRIDVLVNNSGITKDNLLLKMNTETFMDVIDVNLKGTFHSIKAVSRIMMKQRSGVIINMASVIGLIGNPGQANYAASKAGVIALTKTVAKELAPRHIRVNAIAPGFIETDMTDVLNETMKENILKNNSTKSGAISRPGYKINTEVHGRLCFGSERLSAGYICTNRLRTQYYVRS